MDQFLSPLIRIGYIAALCFTCGRMTPSVIKLLKKYKMGKSIRDAKAAPVMSGLHAAKAGTPTMGGIVIWVFCRGRHRGVFLRLYILRFQYSV